MSGYADKQRRSLTQKEVEAVADLMETLRDKFVNVAVSDATVRIKDVDQNATVEVWWDAENELWLADFEMEVRGSG